MNAKGYCLINDTKDSSSIINPEWPVLFPKTNKSQSCIFKGKFCLPKKTKYLVYRYFEENSKTFFAFDDLMSDTVEVWFWKVRHIAGMIITGICNLNHLNIVQAEYVLCVCHEPFTERYCLLVGIQHAMRMFQCIIASLIVVLKLSGH